MMQKLVYFPTSPGWLKSYYYMLWPKGGHVTRPRPLWGICRPCIGYSSLHIMSNLISPNI